MLQETIIMVTIIGKLTIKLRTANTFVKHREERVGVGWEQNSEII